MLEVSDWVPLKIELDWLDLNVTQFFQRNAFAFIVGNNTVKYNQVCVWGGGGETVKKASIVGGRLFKFL